MNVVLPLSHLKRFLAAAPPSRDEHDHATLVAGPTVSPLLPPGFDGARHIADLDSIRVQKAADSWPGTP